MQSGMITSRLRQVCVLIALLALTLPALAQQAPWTVVVPQPATIGVDPDSATAFAELLRGELSGRGMRVLARPQTPPEPCGDPTCGAAMAQRTGSNAAIVVTLSRLGDKIIVQVTHVGADGRILFTDRATAGTLGDLEPLSTRVADAVVSGRPVGATAGTSTVTAQEGQQPTRRKALVTTGVHLGAMAPIADSYGRSSALADLGLLALMELHEIALSAEVEFLWTLNHDEGDVTAFAFQLNLGGRYFIDPEADTGVYLSGGLGFRSLSVNQHMDTGVNNSATGIGVFGGVGVMFLRTSDVHILLDARYDVDLFGVNGISPGGGHGLLVTIGLTYARLGALF